MLQIENLSKQFKDVKALDDVSFQAEDGKITGILGPNGAGKTTCLRIIYSLLKADSGIAKIDDINAAENPLAARKRIGIFPDKFGLYTRLTAREQIAYFAELHGLKKDERDKAVESAIKSLEMEALADRKTEGFSQGQRMKVTLAQAIVHSPKNLILDEPTRGLDVMSTRILRDILRGLRDKGHCILFSSHVMQEVAALCDQVIVLSKGKVAAIDSPAGLCERTGKSQLEEAFISIIGTDEGIAA
ncbi:MAG: ATP-binding cassette domain-containing protein [Pseudomonadota bacterium]